MTAHETHALVTRLKDIVAVLAEADPVKKRKLYEELNVAVAHHPDGWAARIAAGDPRVLRVGVGGGTHTLSTPQVWEVVRRVAA